MANFKLRIFQCYCWIHFTQNLYLSVLLLELYSLTLGYVTYSSTPNQSCVLKCDTNPNILRSFRFEV